GRDAHQLPRFAPGTAGCDNRPHNERRDRRHRTALDGSSAPSRSEVPGMRIIRNAEEGKQLLLSRRPLETEELPMDMRETTFRTFGAELSPGEVVRHIIRDVREDGDNAVRYYNSKVDGATVGDLKVSRDEIAAAYNQLDDELVGALKFAAERIRRYHETQLRGAMFDFQQSGLGQM